MPSDKNGHDVIDGLQGPDSILNRSDRGSTDDDSSRTDTSRTARMEGSEILPDSVSKIQLRDGTSTKTDSILRNDEDSVLILLSSLDTKYTIDSNGLDDRVPRECPSLGKRI